MSHRHFNHLSSIFTEEVNSGHIKRLLVSKRNNMSKIKKNAQDALMIGLNSGQEIFRIPQFLQGVKCLKFCQILPFEGLWFSNGATFDTPSFQKRAKCQKSQTCND